MCTVVDRPVDRMVDRLVDRLVDRTGQLVVDTSSPTLGRLVVVAERTTVDRANA